MIAIPGKLPAYSDAVASFNVDDIADFLDGDLASGLNACLECCDRHTGNNRVALRCLSATQQSTAYTFEDLSDLSARVANVLVSHGVNRGDVVACLLPRTVSLVAVMLGTWRAGAVYQPLFTAFGPKAIEHRLNLASAKFIITDATNRPKLDEITFTAPIAVVGRQLNATDIDLDEQIGLAHNVFEPVLKRGDENFLMMSTSGTTGLPKGVPVPLRALLSFATYMRYAVDLREDDVFWNIADPGWAYGLYYGVIGPLLLGRALILNEAGFTAEGTYQVLEKYGVTSLAGSPTAFRMLISAGKEMAERFDTSLRVVSSAGEPLNPEVVRWFDSVLKVPINDHYGQTELGMVVNNHHGLDHVIHSGSAGLSMPGYRIAVLGDDGEELGPGMAGALAVDVSRSPLLWFSGYLKEETPSIIDGFYKTGDTVEREDDGTISFVGRADDVITSSGYRIGPFDVESALVEHPAVIEAAVIGVPDPERTEIVKAFVVLAQGAEASDELASDISQHVKKRLAAHAYPRMVEFVLDLPKTPSGKIQRFLLRKAEIEKLNSTGTDAA